MIGGGAGLATRLDPAAVVVDALFGTGLARELAEPFRGVVEALDQARAEVVAVDLPSGLDADSGRVLGACARPP